MEARSFVSPDRHRMMHPISKQKISLIPLMGFCYMLQFMDKLALGQATLFNLREDLVYSFCLSAPIY